MSGRFIPLALGVNAALAAVLAALWLGPQGTLRHTVWQMPQAQPSNLDEVANAVLGLNPALHGRYSEVIARPLFTNDRRPIVPEPAPGSEAAAPPPIALDQVVLSGIVAGPSFTGVLAQVEGQQRLLKRGDRVGDWTLDSIKDREVSFTRQGEARALTLKPSLMDDKAMQGDATAGASSAARPPSAQAPVQAGQARPARQYRRPQVLPSDAK